MKTEMNPPYYVEVLKTALTEKKDVNPQYSMRAFARDLNLDSSSLSQILRGKRKLPLKNVIDVVSNLSLEPFERNLFLESFFSNSNIDISFADDRFTLDDSIYYKIISEWEHFVVLDLFDLNELNSVTLDVIASYLGIDKRRGQEVINNLLETDLIKKDQSGSFFKTHSHIKTHEDVKSDAILEANIEIIDMLKDKLYDFSVDERDFSSCSFAIDSRKIPEIKNEIRNFRKRLVAISKSGDNADNVYQVSIQLYPMIQKGKREVH